MLKSHKGKLLLASALTLFPLPAGVLLMRTLENAWREQMGVVEGFREFMSLFSFFLPLVMLAMLWVCVWFTARDPGNQGKNKKVFALVIFLIPLLSNICTAVTVSLALGWELSPVTVILGTVGLMFVLLGNYMPKTTMNATIGIKIPWVYTSQENWAATHRFAGRVWVICGIGMVACAFLPGKAAVAAMGIVIVALIGLPVAYSIRYYRMQKARGDALDPFPGTPAAGKAAIAVTVVLLIFVSAFLFTGDIAYVFEEDRLCVRADYYSDLILSYDAIGDVRLHQGNIPGDRVGGFGSFRLLMGFFQNAELGTYTRYTYYKPESCVVLTLKNRTVVLSAETAEQTRLLYEDLKAAIS